MKRNNSNEDEEIYSSSAVAEVVHDKEIANTLGYNMLLPGLHNNAQLQTLNFVYIIYKLYNERLDKVCRHKRHTNVDISK